MYSLRLFLCLFDGKDFSNTTLGQFEPINENEFLYKFTTPDSVHDWSKNRLLIYPSDKTKTFYTLPDKMALRVYCKPPNGMDTDEILCGETLFRDVYLYFVPPWPECWIRLKQEEITS